MSISWIDPTDPNQADIAGAVAVLEAARAADTPYDLSPTTSSFTTLLQHGWDGEPPMAAVARDATGRVVGVAELWLPRWDNEHLSMLDVTVDPAARRRGIGTALLEASSERARTDGRTTVTVSGPELDASAGFAAAMGLGQAYLEVLRRQDLSAVDWARLDQEYAGAAARARGYETIRIAGETPANLVDASSDLTAAINDAPFDSLAMEDEVFTPERIKAFDVSQRARGRRIYRVVARDQESGTLAGHTVVAVEAEQPWQAWQFDTSVVRAHRGHRLGLLLKIEMLRWLREEEPQLRALDTGNAGSNAHMIRLNEILGYQVLGTTAEWQGTL